MGKITVRHYLNTNLKPYIVDGEKLYSLYFLLRYQNKNTKIKSLIDVELSEKEYSQVIKDKNNSLNTKIKNEVELVEKIINITDKMNHPFEIKLFRDVWEISVYPIIEKFEKYINWQSRKIEQYNSISDYDTHNIESYLNVLNSLKLFVYKSRHTITNELFLIQFFDDTIIKEYKSGLRKNEQHQKIYTPERNEKNNIIETVYKEEEIENLEIIKKCIFGEYRYPFFFQSPKIEKIGVFDIDVIYFQEILGFVSDS